MLLRAAVDRHPEDDFGSSRYVQNQVPSQGDAALTDEEILKLIREALVYAAPEHDARFQDVDWTSSLSALGLDSVGLLDASAYIEEKLQAHFPDDKLARVENVGDFAALIRQHVQSRLSAERRQPA